MGTATVVRDGEIIQIITPNFTPAELAAMETAAASRKAARVVVDSYDLIQRFTDAEYLALYSAMNVQMANSTSQLSRWLDQLRMKGAININAARHQNIKTRLVELGVLTAARANAIFVP